jgi:hypothetical protein
MKRPRGRPPLVASKPKAVVKAVPVILKNAIPTRTPSIAVPTFKVQNTATSVLKNVPASAGQASSTSNTVHTGASSSGEPSEPQNKLPKPPATEVTGKVLSVLMTSEPLSLIDLCKTLVDTPRESIQSVLEVLQVLGVVIQLSTTVSTKDSTSSKSSSSGNLVYLFALPDCAKFPSAFPFSDIEKEVQKIQNGTSEVKERIKELSELSSTLMDEQDANKNTSELRELIDKFLLRAPHLRNDPLYAALLNATSK